MTQMAEAEYLTLHVENIGGISESTVELRPGLTVLSGRNATNRTSLLQAIMAALGSDRATIKGNADEALVELDIGGETYTRRLIRRNGTTVTEGNPYLEDATLADLFAFLLETNEARQAIRTGQDVRNIIIRPVDTAEIEAEIARLRTRRDRIDEQLGEINDLENRLPSRHQDLEEVTSELETTRESLAGVRDEIDSLDRDLEEEQSQTQAFQTRVQELHDESVALEEVQADIESERQSIEALREESEELAEELAEHEAVDGDRIAAIRDEITRLRRQRDQVETSLDKLQTVIQFNKDLLEGSLDVFSDLGAEGGAVTDGLLEESDTIACWTCGTEVSTNRIETMLDDFRDIRNDQMTRRRELTSDIEELEEERSSLEAHRRTRQELSSRIETIDDEIENRSSRLEKLHDRQDELEERVEELEGAVEDLREKDPEDSELLELHKEANRLEVQIERLESDREGIEAEIEQIEQHRDERESLEAERDQITGELEGLRTRVERLEEEAVEQFNEHMATVLDLLNYENITRIWIERYETGASRTDAEFELHVVRKTGDGTVYDDTVDHLSESEREVTGLVFALAGYLVHDAHEEVPFMLLDSVEAIDSDRLATLIEYLNDYTDYLVAALLEEDASALEGDYQYLSEF